MIWNLPGTSVIQGVDEHKGKGTGASTRQDVGAELFPLRSILGSLEDRFDGVLEGKVQGLCGEVSQHVGQVTYGLDQDQDGGLYA